MACAQVLVASVAIMSFIALQEHFAVFTAWVSKFLVVLTPEAQKGKSHIAYSHGCLLSSLLMGSKFQKAKCQRGGAYFTLVLLYVGGPIMSIDGSRAILRRWFRIALC